MVCYFYRIIFTSVLLARYLPRWVYDRSCACKAGGQERLCPLHSWGCRGTQWIIFSNGTHRFSSILKVTFFKKNYHCPKKPTLMCNFVVQSVSLMWFTIYVTPVQNYVNRSYKQITCTR